MRSAKANEMDTVEEMKKAQIDKGIRELKAVEKIKNKLIANGHESIAKKIEYSHNVVTLSLYDSLQIWWTFYPDKQFSIKEYYDIVWEL